MRFPVSLRRELRVSALLLLGAVACLPFAGLAAAAPDTAPDQPASPPAKAGSPLTVPQAAICTDVQDREAVGSASRFPSSVGRLYCLTKIVGAAEPTKVTHLWFHGDTQVHKVELTVGGPAWRTYSYKTVPPGWTGEWRVDVEDAQGVVIYSIPFTVSDAPESSR